MDSNNFLHARNANMWARYQSMFLGWDAPLYIDPRTVFDLSIKIQAPKGRGIEGGAWTGDYAPT